MDQRLDSLDVGSITHMVCSYLVRKSLDLSSCQGNLGLKDVLRKNYPKSVPGDRAASSLQPGSCDK